jgi:hypothetical protein
MVPWIDPQTQATGSTIDGHPYLLNDVSKCILVFLFSRHSYCYFSGPSRILKYHMPDRQTTIPKSLDRHVYYINRKYEPYE